jgi:myo-inositol-1(or 4)-monophosphatase
MPSTVSQRWKRWPQSLRGSLDARSSLRSERSLRCAYKTGARDAGSLRDAVSEIATRVEVLIRERLAKHFPDHGVIGEELAERPGPDSDFVWAIDPVDGTTNAPQRHPRK